MSFGHVLRSGREAKGLSQRQLAEMLDALESSIKVTQPSLHRWEAGVTFPRHVRTIRHIAATLDLDADELIRLAEEGEVARSEAATA